MHYGSRSLHLRGNHDEDVDGHCSCIAARPEQHLPAAALNKKQSLAATEFALNNSVWVLYHEVGHLFVDQFRLPVLGAREEDAADALATLMLLTAATDEAEQTLRDSVEGWFMSDPNSPRPSTTSADFYDPHALDIVRAYGMVCLMVGTE